jgi:Mrp family chromosome partitioning ATPase
MHLLEPSQLNLTATLLEGRVAALYVTATHNGNGTSTVAWSLANTLLNLVTDQVLLIDGHLRSPQISHYFKLGDAAGLTDLCNQEQPTKAEHCIHAPVNSNLLVMPAGRRKDEKLKDLEKEHFNSVLKQLRNRFAFIIFDAPPIFDKQETLAMISCFDGVAIVIDSSHTRHEVAMAALDLVRQAGGKPIGTIFNRRRYHVPESIYKWF